MRYGLARCVVMGDWVLLCCSGSAGSVGERFGDVGLRPSGEITVLWHPLASGLVALGFARVGISCWCLADSVGSVCWLVLVDFLWSSCFRGSSCRA